MSIRIEAVLADYDTDPTHTTTGKPEFLYSAIFVQCSACGFDHQADSLTKAEAMAKEHAEKTNHA